MYFNFTDMYITTFIKKFRYIVPIFSISENKENTGFEPVPSEFVYK